MRILIALLVIASAAYACTEVETLLNSSANISHGECLHVQDINATIYGPAALNLTIPSNSSSSGAWGSAFCEAGNVTYVMNITNVINVTNVTLVNVTNVTVAGGCNATSINMTAPQTAQINNVSISCTALPLTNMTIPSGATIVESGRNLACLAPPQVNVVLEGNKTQTNAWGTFTCNGATTVQNISNCNIALEYTPTTEMQEFADIGKNASVRVKAIPYNYCYENRVETATGFQIYRLDRSNSTIICNPPNATAGSTCTKGAFTLAPGEVKSIGEATATCANQTIVQKEFVKFSAADQNVSGARVISGLTVGVDDVNDEATLKALSKGNLSELKATWLKDTQTRLDDLNTQCFGPTGWQTKSNGEQKRANDCENAKDDNLSWLAMLILIASGFVIVGVVLHFAMGKMMGIQASKFAKLEAPLTDAEVKAEFDKKLTG